jgi:formylglycine-generating enzyme required for sulfatase activity
LVPTGGKLLIVIDQFEQWLFAEKDYAKSSLTDALFQCDGGTIQAVVLVREEFWSSVSRFFRELDIPLADCENSALVDLFDLEHATNVLGLFGRAFEKIPDSRKDWSDDQREFINKSIEGLSEDRKVIPVRIAVFADMMRSRPWTTAALREIGGTEGVGFTFLEEMFGSKHAPVQHRQHQEAVRGVLSALLPDVGTDIKGAMQSADALQTAAGYERKPREFQELLGILDKNLRLITPVDEFVDDGGDNSETAGSRIQSRSYQLAHDYLVPSLRSWLTQKQRETKKGRAELKLAERAAAWSSNKESKHYPTLLEWLQIRLRTDKAQWSNSERLLMRAAGRKHAIYWGNSIAAFAVLTAMTAYLFHQQHLRNQKAIIIQALNSLQVALGRGVSTSIRSLHELGQSGLIRSELERRYANANESSEKILLAFGLAAFGQVESNYLGSQIDEIDNRDLANLIDALGQDPAKSIESLKRLARQCNAEELYRRKARLALAAFALGDDDLPIDASEFEGRTDHGLRTCFIDEFPRWYLETDATRQAVQDSASPALRSAICLALGQIAANRISRKDKARVAQLATKWFSLPDSSTHSAVSWLLRQWDLPEPQLADARQMIEGRNWFVNSQGLTFVRISATPVAVEPDNVLNPGPSYYWLANREVTRSEFEVFVNDSSYAGPKPLTETVRHITQESADSTNGHPIADVSWYEAVIYCNWLSVHEGREPAYRSVGKETVETARDGEIEVDKWEMEKNADGYRLPTESQWEYACRAGTATDWSQGNDKLLLAAYCQMWPSDFVLPCGEKLPNAWGLHDMHGNVSEWCWNLWEKSSSNRAFRGGGWSSRASDWRSANRNWAVPSDRGDFLGFRLLLGPSVK